MVKMLVHISVYHILLTICGSIIYYNCYKWEIGLLNHETIKSVFNIWSLVVG